MEYLVSFFAWLMDWCHSWCPNWWADIVIFTFFTKILQFPVSLWCQVNSLKMVSLMPQEIRIKIDHYGDKDEIGEATAALYKREHYHPLLSLVPLAINIIILMAFVKVIYGIGDTATDSSLLLHFSLFTFHLNISDIPIRDGGCSWLVPLFAGAAAWLLGYSQNILNPLQHEQTRIQQLTTNGISIAISLFLGMFVAAGVGLYWATSNLFSILVQVCENICIPPKKHVDYPLLRRAQAEWHKFESALKANDSQVSRDDRRREKADYRRFFKVANKHLVFYAEGGGYYKYFKPVIEWLLANSNITIHYVTNDPKDGIFEKLKNKSEECKSLEVDQSALFHFSPSLFASRVRAYYIGPRRIIPLMMKMDADMVVMTTPDLNTYHIKRSYVKKDVEYVYLDHGPTSVHMCYRKGAFDHFDTIMCNGPFQVAEHRATEKVYNLKPKKLVESGYPLLDTLERSEKGKVKSEEGEKGKVKSEEGEKGKVKSEEGEKGKVKSEKVDTSAFRIMIANSHQKDNIFDTCLEDLITSIVSYFSNLSSSPSSLNTYHSSLNTYHSSLITSPSSPSSPFTFHSSPFTFHSSPFTFPSSPFTFPSSLTLVLRPHPQYVRRNPARWQALKEKLSHHTFSPSTFSPSTFSPFTFSPFTFTFSLIIEDNFSLPSTMDQSSVLITDWSGIAYEFAYKTRRPTLFIDTPMKVINPEWKKIDLVPTDISFRNEVGKSLAMSDVKAKAGAAIADMLAHPDTFAAQIDKLFATQFFNTGHAGEVAGAYILDALIEKRKVKSDK